MISVHLFFVFYWGLCLWFRQFGKT